MADTPAMHYVCTIEQAEEIVASRSSFWVSNCGCREGKGSCSRSRMDVCISFSGSVEATGSGKREIDPDEVREIFLEARSKLLVPRPFRSEDRTATDGVCFCCDDCCGYFLDKSEVCDKGALVEKTEMDNCTNCLACIPVCHFGARDSMENALVVNREECYGCGLCARVCPTRCIAMMDRNAVP